MGDLHTLKVHGPKLEPNERIIELLRQCLKEAKEGKIQAIGIATSIVDFNEDNNRSSVSVYSYAPGWFHSIQAACAGLFTRIHESIKVDIEAPKLTDEDE